MKYVSIPEPGRVELKEKDVPAPLAGEALLRLLYGGICGSDLGTYKGSFLYAKYPRIPGHEFSAEIVSIEANEFGLRKGMIVTGNPYYNCGSCYSCRRGHVNCCTSNQTLGAQRDGAFQQYMTMPIERIYDSKGLPARTVAAIEPFCIGYHAVKRAKVGPRDRVLVVGAGPIGLLAAIAAKLTGAQVYISDVAEGKLALAGRFGLDGTILASDEKAFSAQVAQITEGDGFDVCIEAVGLPSTFMNCINAAAHRARVVVVGIGKMSFDFFYSILQTKELDVFGSRNALKEDFLEVIDIVSGGKVALDSIVTDEYRLDEVERAFSELKANGGEKLKVMIKFP